MLIVLRVFETSSLIVATEVLRNSIEANKEEFWEDSEAFKEAIEADKEAFWEATVEVNVSIETNRDAIDSRISFLLPVKYKNKLRRIAMYAL